MLPACTRLCVHAHLGQVSLRTLGLAGLPAVKSSDLAALERVIDKDIPEFRRFASKASAFAPPPAAPAPKSGQASPCPVVPVWSGIPSGDAGLGIGGGGGGGGRGGSALLEVTENHWHAPMWRA